MRRGFNTCRGSQQVPLSFSNRCGWGYGWRDSWGRWPRAALQSHPGPHWDRYTADGDQAWSWERVSHAACRIVPLLSPRRKETREDGDVPAAAECREWLGSAS